MPYRIIGRTEYAVVISKEVVGHPTFFRRIHTCPACGLKIGNPTGNANYHDDGDEPDIAFYEHLEADHRPEDFGLSPLGDGRDPYGDGDRPRDGRGRYVAFAADGDGRE